VILDLFCCQGGASAGYAAAGFDVVGVDVSDQPRYPYDFHRADALTFLRQFGTAQSIQGIHASPPCQGHSRTWKLWGRDWPDLIAPTRKLLRQTGIPYIIENVEGAPLHSPFTLCGSMFGLRTYRHRLFELGGGFTARVPQHPSHTAPMAKMGRAPLDGEMIHAVGNFSGVELVRRDWAVPWMNRDGIREAIPPVYTEWLGVQLLGWLENNL
jgi:DNA (cytosine-5)-methyltransferase 1